MNRCSFLGRLTADPEVKYSSVTQKAIVGFTVAVKRDYKNKDGNYDTDFFNCMAYDKRAEIIGNNFSKGSRICVWGQMRQDKWTDKEGNSRSTYRLYVEGFDFVDSGGGSAARGNAAGAAKPAVSSAFDGLGEEVDF